MELQIVNPDPKYERARLVEPTTLGYLYVAASIRPSPFPTLLPSRRRSELIVRVKERARQVESLDGVVRATVFRAVIMPPARPFSVFLSEHKASLHVANFDLVVLIETRSPAVIRAVQLAPEYVGLMELIRKKSKLVRIIAAKNEKRIGEVDTSRPGLFLFNHFAAEDRRVMLQLWEYLTDWYEVETGLDNSVAMVPLPGEPSDYALVNWARWDKSPLRHLWSQLSKRSFWNYVAANLDANHAASMPIYYHLA